MRSLRRGMKAIRSKDGLSVTMSYKYRGHGSLRMLTCTVIHKAESALLLDVDSLDIQIKVRISLNTYYVSIHTKTQ